MRISMPLITLICALIGSQAEMAWAVTFATPADKTAAAQSLESLVSSRGIATVKQQIDAAKLSSGDIDQAVKSVLGMSVRDIRKHGLLGAQGSQLRQLFAQLGLPH